MIIGIIGVRVKLVLKRTCRVRDADLKKNQRPLMALTCRFKDLTKTSKIAQLFKPANLTIFEW
jgi:hypothetical protein